MIELLVVNWLCVFAIMVVAWLVYLFTKNPGVIDVFWSLVICFSGLHYALLAWSRWTGIVLQILLVLWALRLAGYLLITRVMKQHIDRRYRDLSADWKVKKLWGFFFNYQLQGVLAIFIATPFLFIADALRVSMMIGLVVAVFGLVGECISDRQLQQFKRTHQGEVCNVGFWYYSRHPNYFFEWLIWMGFAIAGSSAHAGWIGFLSPALLLFLMLKVTGPITEKASLKSRGALYVAYQRKTSMFFPWLPKRK